MSRTLKFVSGIILFILLVQCEEITPTPPPSNGTDPGDVITDPDELVPVDGDYANCLNLLSQNTLDIVTWNIEQFSENNTSTTRLKEMILIMDADIIGVQEITSITDFNTMISELDGWQAAILSQSGLSTGYIYKSSEITLTENLSLIYEDDGSAFPRAPVIGKFSHISGMEVIVMNLHLKCCGGSSNEQRRRDASEKLKTYIDGNLPNDRVIVIGDYNDEIQELPNINVFQNLINDAENYLFTDMEIAQGSTDDFSYPSWPSHLDHILITNELFDNHEYTQTVKLDECYGSYEVNISDHRPVLARFSTN